MNLEQIEFLVNWALSNKSFMKIISANLKCLEAESITILNDLVDNIQKHKLSSNPSYKLHKNKR